MGVNGPISALLHSVTSSDTPRKKVSEDLSEIAHAVVVAMSDSVEGEVFVGASHDKPQNSPGLPKLDEPDMEVDVYYRTSDKVLHADARMKPAYYTMAFGSLEATRHTLGL